MADDAVKMVSARALRLLNYSRINLDDQLHSLLFFLYQNISNKTWNIYLKFLLPTFWGLVDARAVEVKKKN